MRPKTKVANLPSINDIHIFLHNAFIQRLDKLKQDIQVRLVFFVSIFELSLYSRMHQERSQQRRMAGLPTTQSKVTSA
jgi:hypothetical protein